MGRRRFRVTYYRCVHCQLIFTDFIDDWTIDEISRFIYNDDYVKVDPEYLRRPAAPHGGSFVERSSWL